MVKVGRYDYKKSTNPNKKLMVVVEKDGKKKTIHFGARSMQHFKDKTNINAWMVRNGHAVAYRKYSKKFVSQEIFAKKEKLGLWSGTFMMPWDYRKNN